MTFQVVTQVLGAAVATAGTFTGSYPSGFSAADFVGGVRHKIAAVGALFEAPKDFTIAFTSTTVFTITWLAATTLPAGATVRVQLDMPGDTGMKDWASQASFPTMVPTYVHNSVPCVLRYVDIGSPIAKDDSKLRANAALATTGSFTLLTAGLTMDVPRNIILTSSGDDSGGLTFTVTGTDEYGAALVETITGANAGVASGVKAFKTVTTITNSVAAAANVKVGWGNVFGLPVWLPATTLILADFQDYAAPANAATKVAGLSALTKSTATTADVRGTYAPNTNAANIPNSARCYSVLVAIPDPSHIGVPQYGG